MSTISAVLGRRVQLKGLIGKRAMKCPYCDFYFMKNGSDLQRHIWAHEGECSPSGAERLLLACFAWSASGDAVASGLLQVALSQCSAQCVRPPATPIGVCLSSKLSLQLELNKPP